MCLFTPSGLTEKAKKDIIVYKEFCVDNNFSIFSPYQAYRPEFNKKLKAVGTMSPTISGRLWRYGKGGFHSYFLLEDAAEAAEVDNNILRDSFVVFKCIIPKGVKYVKGMFNNAFAIISKQIIVTKEVVAFYSKNLLEEEFKKHLESC